MSSHNIPAGANYISQIMPVDWLVQITCSSHINRPGDAIYASHPCLTRAITHFIPKNLYIRNAFDVSITLNVENQNKESQNSSDKKLFTLKKWIPQKCKVSCPSFLSSSRIASHCHFDRLNGTSTAH